MTMTGRARTTTDLPGKSGEYNPMVAPPAHLGTTPAHGPGNGVGNGQGQGQGYKHKH